MTGAGAGGRECPCCQGTGFETVRDRDREYARRCGCRRGSGAWSAREADPLQAAGVPPSHRQCTLGNFRPRTPALSAALDRALAYCHRFADGRQGDGLGLVFWGGPSTGKTHLAVAVLSELAANHDVAGRFCDFTALLGEIAHSYDRASMTSESKVLEAVLTADLLVLDDLGSRRMTDWAADTLFSIVNGRYMARRPTVITTAYEDVDREVALQADARRRQEFLIERLGQRLRSRLLEMCVLVPMQGAPERSAQRAPSRPSTLGAMRRSAKG